MSMIYIINRQTDRIIGHLNNRGDKVFKDDLHVRDLSTGENTFTFTMAAKIKQAALFNHPITLAIRKEEGDFAEFIPFQGHTIDNWTKVFGIASYVDIETQKTIPPGTYSGSLRELAGVALDGCDHELGTVEYVGSRTITIEDSMGPYSFLSKLKQEFEVEMDVRMKTSGPRIRKRYIDFYKRIGRDTNKEIRRGKDMLKIERLINNDRIVTALQVEGPKRADGRRLSVMVSDEAAFQRWNVKGKHRIKIYRPATDNQDITVEELERLGEIELKKYIDTIFIYILTAKDIGRLFEHERLWLGDRCRAVDEEFSPPLYADARAIRVERSISDTAKKVVKIGEVVTYTEDEIFQKFLNLQLAYGTRVIKSPNPPAGDSKIIWIKTEEGSDFEVAHTWNGSEWIPITPTRAEQIGAETPEGAQEKAEEEARKAKEYAESRAEYERLQGHAVQLLTEKNGYEQQYLDAYNSPTLYTASIKTNLHTTWNAYSTAFNNLYNAITTAASDEAITQTERDDVETKTIAYRAALTNFTAAHAAAVKDIAAGLAKDAEEAATDYYEEFGQKKITQGLVAPSNPVTGDLWIDTSLDPYQWKQWNGTDWVTLTPTNLSQLGGQLVGEQLADGAVEAAKIRDGAITGPKIVDGVITAPKIGNLAIDATKIAPNAVTTDKLVDGVVSTVKLGNLAVDATKLANNAVTTVKILDGAIADAKIAAGAVTSGKIFDGAITNVKLGALAVDAAKIANGAVTELKLSAGAVTNEKLAALAVDAAKLADSSITATKIANLAVGTAAIANGAITTAKIGNAQITSALIGDAQITAAKIAALAVGTAAIQDAAITNAKVGALDASKITTGRLDAARVQIGSGTEFANGYDPTKIEVGARNLLINSNFAQGNRGWYSLPTISDDNGLKYVSTSYTFNVRQDSVKVEPSTEYAFSSKIRGTGNARIAIFTSLDNVNYTNTHNLYGGNSVDWKRASFGTITTPADTKFLRLYYLNTTAGEVTDFTEMKIEKGNKATDWTPAPEDNPAILWQYADTTFIDGGDIYTNTITANQIAAGTITANELSSNSITAVKIAAGAITADKIAANSITAAQIATNAITADELASNSVKAVNIEAGAVTSDKITANAVTAVKIAAGSIEAAKIATDAITADKIAANSITASELAANSVTADAILAGSITAVKIAANAIESDKIAANAITTGKIQAGGVTATNIAAGAITASKLAVASQNMLWDIDTFEQYPEGAEPNGSVGGSTNSVVSEVASPLGKMVLKHVSTTTNSYKYLAPAPYTSHGWARVQNGKRYILSAYVMTTSATATTVNLAAVAREFGSGTSATSGTGTGSLSLSAADGWKRISVFAPTVNGTDPAYALYARNASAGVTTYWTGFQLEEYNGLDATPSPFVPGGSVYIHGGNIAANSVTAAQIAANTITANQIASKTITSTLISTAGLDAGVIKFGTMDGSLIQAETISSTQIEANAITTSELSANAVTATKIAAGAITTDKLAAGAITADKISAGAITSDKISAGTLTGLTINGGTINGSEFRSPIPSYGSFGMTLKDGYGEITDGSHSTIWNRYAFSVYGGAPPAEPGSVLLVTLGSIAGGYGIRTTSGAAVVKSDSVSDDVLLDPGSGYVGIDGYIRNESILTPTFVNGWTHFSTTSEPWQRGGYWKDKNEVVHLVGLIKSGTTTNGTVLFTLPVGYRPAKQEVFIVTTITGTARIDVYPNGQVIGARDLHATWTSLAGITFKAA